MSLALPDPHPPPSLLELLTLLEEDDHLDLLALLAEGRMTLGDASRRLRRASPAVERRLAALERTGLITREVCHPGTPMYSLTSSVQAQLRSMRVRLTFITSDAVSHIIEIERP